MPRQSFTEVFGLQRGGAADLQAAEKLADVLEAVKKTGKVGSLTVTLTIKPNGEQSVYIADTIKVSKPELPTRDSHFYLTDAGQLTRKNPNQLPLRELVEDND